nr:Putative single strand-annealing protein [uncultured Mediterranean phage uvMED]
MKKNIYQKLHSACLQAGAVKKADKVKGMHFNPLLHDAVQEVATQALLDNNLYVTCNYLTEVMDKADAIMVVCTMKVHDIDDPTSFVIVDGCSAMGAMDKFGTGNAMSYSRKYAFLNLLNLKTGIKDEDGYQPKSFNKISKEQSKETSPVYLDDNVDAEEIKEYIQLAKNSKQFYSIADRYKNQLQYLMKNNSKAYKQIKKIADAKELQLNNNVQQ